MSKKEKTKAVNNFDAEEEILDIPEDQIWTYQIEGLQAPKIVERKVDFVTKVVLVIVLLIVISLAIFFSVYAVANDEYKYTPVENGYELIKYTNVNNSTEIHAEFINGNKDMPVTVLHEYAFNCDERVQTIYLGKDVESIDGKSFYSCWALENVFVDDANPYYCDIDGVLYDKALTKIIYYPTSHNIYLARQAGYSMDFDKTGVSNDDFSWAVSDLNKFVLNGGDLSKPDKSIEWATERIATLTGQKDLVKFMKDYNEKIGYYVLPSTVTEIGKLSFAYSDILAIYMPEGVKKIDFMAFFKAEKLGEIYSYTTEGVIDSTVYKDTFSLIKPYKSLPEGLLFIGSDCFSYDRIINYMYIPESVRNIGHHAFYNTCYKEDGNIIGIAKMNVAMDEEHFNEYNEIGENWLPKYDSGLFKKSILCEYGATREN